MTVTASPYGWAAMHLGSGRFNVGSEVFKVALTTSAYTPNIDTHKYYSDITNEVVGTNYTSGGVAIPGLWLDYDVDTNQTIFMAATTIFSNVTLTARRAVVYQPTETASTSPLLSWVDFGTDQSPYGNSLIIPWPAEGLLRISVV